MASSSGTTSSGSEENPSDPQQKVVLDERRRKRMLSNRESARRSRMRKQKHFDELMTQVEQLRKENNQILTNYNITTHRYVAVEAENSVLRTQMVELNHRLESLNEILNHLDRRSSNIYSNGNGNGHFFDFNLPMDLVSTNFSLPIMASPDMFLC